VPIVFSAYSAYRCANPDVALGVDVWTCIECGIVQERDPNAAINLEKRGLAPKWCLYIRA
jgi:transposase